MERLWEREYKKKRISAEKAASLIQNGDSLTSGGREPATILEELGIRTDLKDVISVSYTHLSPFNKNSLANFGLTVPNFSHGLINCGSFSSPTSK